MLHDFLFCGIQLAKPDSNIIIAILFTFLIGRQIPLHLLFALEFIFLLFHKLFQTIKIWLAVPFRNVAIFFINVAIIQHLRSV